MPRAQNKKNWIARGISQVALVFSGSLPRDKAGISSSVFQPAGKCEPAAGGTIKMGGKLNKFVTRRDNGLMVQGLTKKYAAINQSKCPIHIG